MTNGRGMQLAGTAKLKTAKVLLQNGVLARYMAGGAWRADLSKGGKVRWKRGWKKGGGE